MHELKISETKKTPKLVFDNTKGIIELKGSSIMEDTITFYNPVMEWVYEYIRNPKDTTVNVHLEYFNTSSAKVLLILFKTLAKIERSGRKLEVNWYYADDDEDIMDSGHNFSMSAKLKFNFIEISSHIIPSKN
jgi:hypothetical protein